MNPKIYIFCIILLIHFLNETTAQKNNDHTTKLLKKYTEKIDFIINQGQWEKEIVYRADLSKTQVRFLKDKVSFGTPTQTTFPQRPKIETTEEETEAIKEKDLSQKEIFEHYAQQKTSIEGFVWNMGFEGANPEVEVLGKHQKDVLYNYYLGKVKEENISAMAEVWYENIYPHTDIRFYSAAEGLEYDIILKPNARPENIQITLEGIENMYLDATGNLVYETPWGNMTKEAPYAYQIIKGQEIAIATQYKLEGNSLSFEVLEDYNAYEPLVIDPLVLKWSTYLGGAEEDSDFKLEEYRGNLYVTGYNYSANFPTTAGSFQQTYGGGISDLFFSKLDKDGNLLASTYIGGSGYDYENWTFFKEGTWYVSASVTSADFPITPGAHRATKASYGDDALVEVDSNLNLVYSSYLGGLWSSYSSQSIYNSNNGKLYLESHGKVTSATNRTLNAYNSYDDVIICYNTLSHQIEEIVAMPVDFSIQYFTIEGSDLFMAGRIDAYYTSTNYTHLGAHQTSHGGGYGDVYVLKLDENFTPLMATYLGGNDSEYFSRAIIKDGFFYIMGTTGSPNFPTTANAFQPNFGGGTSDDLFVVKMDLMGNVLYSTYIGGAEGESFIYDSKIEQYFDAVGNLYLAGRTASTDFPTSLGAFQATYGGGLSDHFILRMDPNGQVDWGTYLGGDGADVIDAYQILNNEVIGFGYSTSSNFTTTLGAHQNSHGGAEDAIFYKIDISTGTPTYSTYIGGSGSERLGHRRILVDGSDIYLLAATSSPNLPVTAGAAQTSYGGDNDLYIAKISAQNSFDFLTYLGGNAEEDYNIAIKLVDGVLHLMGATEFPNNHTSTSNTFPVTTTAFQNVHRVLIEEDLFYAQLDGTTGALLYSTLIGGSGDDFDVLENHLIVSGKDVYIGGATNSNDFPVTQGAHQTTHGGEEDIYILKLSTCVDSIHSDSIHPLSQMVCREATVNPLIGTSTEAFLPIILRNNIPENTVANSPSFRYVWQDSIAGGNWTNIAGATGKDFLPPELTATTYYRRVVVNTCGRVIGYSNEAVIQVITNQAPIADAGDSLVVCVGGSVLLGGTTTGGTPAYTYAWTPSAGLNNPTLEQPTATLNNSTVYTLEVTDANGCVHKDQVLVKVIAASAGADVFACQGAGVRIGQPAPIGVGGLSYAWSPTTGLSDPTIAQPIANPSSPTTYTVTITGPSGCPMVDDVLVTPITVPSAGVDQTICAGNSVVLGQAGQAGYTYNWSPGLYLDNPNIAQPTFRAGSNPVANPLTYSLTAVHDASGCAATTSLNVAVGQANAGINGCGPRYIGTADQSGGLATYSWTVLAGDVASLTTPNISQPIVDPSSNTLYELTVSLNGMTCTDQVLVTANCGCPAFNISASSNVNCPIGDSSANTVLQADFRDTTHYTFNWSPTTDLSDPNSPITTVTGNFTLDRVYTLTITNKLDTTITCSENIRVLGSTTTLPQVNTRDTIACAGTAVSIGVQPEAGKSYFWTPSIGLSDPAIANPTTSLNYSRAYVLHVTDDLTGCRGQDTTVVFVREVGADAGEDADFCDGAIVTLGTTALPNRTYSWQPANALGNPTAAQPIDTIFITTSYYLTVIDTLSGCIERDTITFTEGTAPIADAGADSVTICQGANIRIGTTPVAGVTYSWTPTTGLSDPNSAQPIASPSSTTTYQLIASTTNGTGCYAVDEIKVKVSASNAPANNAGNDQSICIGGTSLIGTTAIPNYTYVWSPAATLDDSSLAQPTADPLVNTTYTVTITDLATGCSTIDDVVVNVSTPSAYAGLNRTMCPGEEKTLGPYSATTGYTYNWTPTTGLDDPTDHRPTVSGLPVNSNILYTLVVTDSVGCTAMDTVRVVVEQGPTAGAGPDVTSCSGVQLGTTYVSGFSYKWSPATGLNATTISRPLATVNEPTTYILTVRDANYCEAHDTVVVTPAVVVNAGPNQVICSGESTLIGTPGVVGATYAWSPSIGLNDPTIAQPTASPTAQTTYVVSVTLGACTRVDSVVVDVITPTIDLGGDVVLCNGSCATIGTQAQPGKYYQWSPSTGLSNPTSALTNVCPTTTAIYTLEEIDIAYGCIATDDILVEVKNTAAPSAIAGRDTSICPGNTVMLGTTNNANYSYTWSPVIGLNNPYIANPTASPSATTSYMVTVVDNTTGCFAVDTVTVVIGTIPTLPTLNDITICTGSTSMIGAVTNDPYVYSWSPSLGLDDPTVSNPTANPSATTIYQLLVEDTISGCNNSGNLTVTVSASASPVIADAGEDMEVCLGEVVTLGSSNTTTGATYAWSPSALLSSGSVAQPTKTIPSFWRSGTYTLIVTKFGCTSVDQVVVNAKPEVIIEAGTDKVICGDSTILAASSTSLTNYWSLESGPNTPVFGDVNNPSSTLSGLVPGVYTLRWNVSGNAACNTGYDITQVTVGGMPELAIANPATACPTVDLTASAVTAGSTLHGAVLSYWTDALASIPVLNPTNVGFSGQYFIQARTSLGCEDIAPVEATIDCDATFLPIELLDFRARLQHKNTALLEWETGSEENINGFYIEQALPSTGIPVFEEIAFVGSKGAANIASYYTHEVPNLVAGVHYFRLKQVEEDGYYTYSTIRAVRVNKDYASVVMYPNPTNHTVTIELGAFPKENVTIDILNNLGQTVLTKKNRRTQSIQLDLSQLASTSYMVKVKFGNTVKVFKLIKE